MSRLRGFAAYDSVTPTAALAPALQLLCKEHAKLRRGMEDIWRFAMKAPARTGEFVEDWLKREQKFRAMWGLHTAKEERVLMATLSKYVDSDRGPLAVMKYEHERLDVLFDEWEQNIGLLMADPSNEPLFQEALDRFRYACQMKGDHCFKEEKAIYAVAQGLLSDAEKVLLLQQFRKIK